MRNLQVAVSSLRQMLHRALQPDASIRIERDGDAYRLTLGPDVEFDLLEFDLALDRGRRARAAGDPPTVIAACERILDLYTADLLPEDGPAEWVVTQRERRRWEAAGAARTLAEQLLEAEDAGSAARACQRGLQIDPYQDALWRMLIAAHERVPNPLAAARARRRYAEVLEGLGLGCLE